MDLFKMLRRHSGPGIGETTDRIQTAPHLHVVIQLQWICLCGFSRCSRLID